MFSRRLVGYAAIVGFCSAALIAQQSRRASSSGVLREFPIVLQQTVEAGKTPVGTKVKGKLAVATQFHGTLIPRDAVVSGVIFQSVRKSGKDPSRLGIRMESAKWKDSSACMMRAYLMPLYYPLTTESAQGSPIESPDPDSRTLNGPNQSGSSPMSAPSANNSEAIKEAVPQIATIASRPVSMKNVSMEPVPDDGIELVSQHDNIKLYKMTTYVLAAIEAPTK
ncbi:MAG TPA: hypothetical protein VL156_04635 [Terriglobales bacterium]|jgi:hypothetical protein|nr:hypothetical protein [Terriglobales bacterium]